MPKRIKVIANPVSGRGRAGRIAPQVIRRLRDRGCELDYAETRRKGDATRFAREVAGYDVVACIGGDGTVNEVINGLPDEGAPPIAFIPAGTANVLAKELRLPWTVGGLADVILDGDARRVDLGINRTTGQKFLLFAGAGFDSIIVEDFHRRRKGRIHMAQYIWWGVRAIPFFRAPRLTVEVDGRVEDTEAAWVEVSNTSKYGGPLVFTPDADPANGSFEVMIQRGRGIRNTMHIFFSALVSYLFRVRFVIRDVRFVRGTRVSIRHTDGERVPLQVDGDPGGELPVELELRPASVRIMARRGRTSGSASGA